MNLHEIQKNLTTDAMLVFRNNHFLGQDILDTENQISALTGFDGSAGTLLITRKKAFLFVEITLSKSSTLYCFSLPDE